MSDRGEDTAAPGVHGAPTGPLPGPRPPVSGWPQQSPHGTYAPTPNQSTAPLPTNGYGGPPANGYAGQPTNGYGGSPTSGYAPPSPTGHPSPTGLPSPSGYPSPGPGAPTSSLPFGAGAPGAPPAPPGGNRQRSGPRPLGLVGLVLSIVLLLAVIGQGVLLAGLNSDLDAARASQSQAKAASAKDREDLSNLTKRVQGLEERTEGTLNSTAVAKKVLPSVFSVRAGQSTGTAFAFGTAPGGGTLLITNFHVVDSLVSAGGKNATITRGSDTYPVTIDRTDKNRDLAVLRTKAKFTPLKPAAAEVEPGDPVIVVGAPLGLTDTVTTGVVSAIRDDIEGLATRVIQFDAAINPGNSGGPVINAEGEVVGIAQAKIIAEGADGLGLAIPIAEACKDNLITC